MTSLVEPRRASPVVVLLTSPPPYMCRHHLFFFREAKVFQGFLCLSLLLLVIDQLIRCFFFFELFRSRCPSTFLPLFFNRKLSSPITKPRRVDPAIFGFHAPVPPTSLPCGEFFLPSRMQQRQLRPHVRSFFFPARISGSTRQLTSNPPPFD